MLRHAAKLKIERIAVTTCLCLILASTSVSQEFETIALTGDQVPDAIEGVIFDAFGRNFTGPILNGAGQVAFEALVAGTGVDRSNDTAIFAGSRNSLGQIARNGEQVPGAAAGVSFNGFGRFLSFNESGQAAFLGLLSGPGVDLSNSRGIYRGDTGGSLVQIARRGDQAPNAASGVNFTSLSGFVVNDSGHTGFLGSLTGTDVISNSNDHAIYSDRSGSLAEIARAGNQAPNADSGVNFFRLDNPVINESGSLVFEASLTGTPDNQGLYSNVSGTLAQVVRSGEQAPGAAADVVFGEFGAPNLNDSGHIAFLASLRGTQDSGVFRNIEGTLEHVALAGNQAPGEGTGITFSSFIGDSGRGDNLVLNSLGQTAFTAELEGTGVDQSNNRAIYSEGTGSLQRVARIGEQAPGASEDVVFSYFRNLAFNDNGQTAFAAGLRGFEVDSTNSQAIYATDLEGTLFEVVRTGDLFDVNSDPLIDDLRTISILEFSASSFSFFGANQFGNSSGFNDLGQIAFAATFTDGTSGIFVSNIVAVPEPTSLAFLIFGAFGLLAQRRRK